MKNLQLCTYDTSINIVLKVINSVSVPVSTYNKFVTVPC